MRPWVVLHWLEHWFGLRHTGGGGHTAEQARRHARRYLATAREIPGPELREARSFLRLDRVSPTRLV